MKVKAESSLFVLSYVKHHPGCTGYEICTNAPRDIRKKVASAITRLTKGRAFCVDRYKQPHMYYDVNYYGCEKRIETLREFTTWLSQFEQEKEGVSIYLAVVDKPTTIRVRG